MRHGNFSNQPRKTIAITGSSGLIGSKLRSLLQAANHDVIRIVRSRKETDVHQIEWSPREQKIDKDGLEEADIVVHLAGESVFGRWSDQKQERIMESRRLGTQTISEAIVELDNPPELFISSSAVGFYGDTGDEWVDEESPSGEGFLAKVCREWETQTQVVKDNGIRTVNLRTGIALSSSGGALATMLPLFKFGLGGPIGDGEQYMSWIGIEDLVGIIYTTFYREQLRGPVNAVSPNPVTNREFSKTLGDVLNRPAFMKAPAFAMKMIGGQAAKEMLLWGQRTRPKKLEEIDFDFHYPELEEALRYELS